jgi:hypothetical protein
LRADIGGEEEGGRRGGTDTADRHGPGLDLRERKEGDEDGVEEARHGWWGGVVFGISVMIDGEKGWDEDGVYGDYIFCSRKRDPVLARSTIP